MKTILALAACCAVVATPFALASEGDSTAVPAEPQASPCTPLKTIYSEKNWRDRTPANGQTPCPTPNARSIKEHFRLYRHYRQIAPYRCHKGSEGYYAIPCYVIACESRFNWWAMNPSGASYVYQLLGWGAPPPSSFRNRVRNHEIAASLSLSNWVCF